MSYYSEKLIKLIEQKEAILERCSDCGEISKDDEDKLLMLEKDIASTAKHAKPHSSPLYWKSQSLEQEFMGDNRRVETRSNDKGFKMETATIDLDDGYKFDPEGTEERDVFNRYLLSGLKGLTTEEYRRMERRALQADLDTQGGYLAPREVIDTFLKGLDNALFIRDRARKFQVNAQEAFVPALDQDPGSPEWTQEIKTGSEDEDMRLGARQLHPHPLARRIKVSNKLLRIATINPESIVRDRLTFVAGAVLEASYMTGDGTNSPLGLFTVSDYGITADRDRETANAGTVKADDLIDVAADLAAQYRRGAVWIASREFLRRTAKLKDGNGQFLIQQDMRSEFGTTLLGHELLISEYAPSTWTSGNYACIFGNPQWYWIADSLNMQIKRLDELYSETDQTGFILRYEGDAMPVLPAAWMRLKIK